MYNIERVKQIMYTYQSPFGIITYDVKDNCLVSASFVDKKEITSDNNGTHQEIIDQLNLYFKSKLKAFTIPIRFNIGTTFQREVWEALLEIPYGETRSYEEIAIRIGRPKAIRAVGQACKRNQIGLFVPCHRVIGKDGSMKGYSGKSHIELKEKLLAFERRNI